MTVSLRHKLEELEERIPTSYAENEKIQERKET